MRRSWLIPILISGLLVLSGCNMVVSEKPWFGEADAAGVPPLREGMWANFDAKTCQFDPGQAVNLWPDCARPMLVLHGAYYELADKEDDGAMLQRGQTRWKAMRHLLVSGDPLIDQLYNDEKKTSPDDAKYGQFYAAARIVQTASDGSIIELVRWAVVCGPLDPKGLVAKRDKSGSLQPDRYVTAKPFPGLIVNDTDCRAKDIAALRHAAALSETVAIANGAAKVTSRWVRANVP